MLNTTSVFAGVMADFKQLGSLSQDGCVLLRVDAKRSVLSKFKESVVMTYLMLILLIESEFMWN